MNHGNLFTTIPLDLTKEVFEVLAQTTTVKIERIISKGHTSPETGWYDQGQNEWVAVLQGAATLEFDDGHRVEMAPGSYLNIPAHTKHRVVWTTPEQETIWLAVFY